MLFKKPDMPNEEFWRNYHQYMNISLTLAHSPIDSDAFDRAYEALRNFDPKDQDFIEYANNAPIEDMERDFGETPQHIIEFFASISITTFTTREEERARLRTDKRELT